MLSELTELEAVHLKGLIIKKSDTSTCIYRTFPSEHRINLFGRLGNRDGQSQYVLDCDDCDFTWQGDEFDGGDYREVTDKGKVIGPVLALSKS